jgi:hypothetical protein
MELLLEVFRLEHAYDGEMMVMFIDFCLSKP